MIGNMYSPYPIKLESVLNEFSNEEQIALLKVIAKYSNDTTRVLTPSFLIEELNFNKRDLNQRMEKLLTFGIVDMVYGTYAITRFGKEVFNTLIMIEDAIKICSTFKRDEILGIPDDISNEPFIRQTETFF